MPVQSPGSHPPAVAGGIHARDSKPLSYTCYGVDTMAESTAFTTLSRRVFFGMGATVVAAAVAAAVPRPARSQNDASPAPFAKYKCSICGFIYDEAQGSSPLPPGTRWANVPDDWTCPDCGAPKAEFEKIA